MYICERCGDIVDKLPVHQEYFGEYWGFPANEMVSDDYCECGGDYVEAVECCICGEIVPECETENGICNECIESESTEGNILHFAETLESEDIHINPLIAYMFSSEDIEAEMKKIMCQKIAKEGFIGRHKTLKMLKDFAAENKAEFADYLRGTWKA